MNTDSNGVDQQVSQLKYVVLAGGVGGAKLVDGLSRVLPSENLTVIVNSGDDFQHMGLTICPDFDTVMYTLAKVANPETGWGRIDESWITHQELIQLDGPDWFHLGDRDLATHLVRTHLLSEQRTLTEVANYLRRQFGIGVRLLPMSDEKAPTKVDTDDGLLSFQTWFVEKHWQPVVHNIVLPANIKATPAVLASLEEADVVIIAPSNPFVSIDPILNVYPIHEMVSDLPELVMAVSPIIAGQAVKGPAAKMMRELGMEPSAAAVARFYDPLLDAFVYDIQDDQEISIPQLYGYRTDTLMDSTEDRKRLAQEIVSLSVELLAA